MLSNSENEGRNIWSAEKVALGGHAAVRPLKVELQVRTPLKRVGVAAPGGHSWTVRGHRKASARNGMEIMAPRTGRIHLLSFSKTKTD